MTGNSTRAVLDAADLLRGVEGSYAGTVRARFAATVPAIIWYAAGSAPRPALSPVRLRCLIEPAWRPRGCFPRLDD